MFLEDLLISEGSRKGKVVHHVIHIDVEKKVNTKMNIESSFTRRSYPVWLSFFCRTLKEKQNVWAVIFHTVKVNGNQGLWSSKAFQVWWRRKSFYIYIYIFFLSQNLALKILPDSCGHHSLSLYEKEKVGLSAINNLFCVSHEKESHGFPKT